MLLPLSHLDPKDTSLRTSNCVADIWGWYLITACIMHDITNSGGGGVGGGEGERGSQVNITMMSYSLCRCPLKWTYVNYVYASVCVLAYYTFSHLCDVTRTHFSTKAHWVTLYWHYEMHPFFWWHLHLSGGLESRQKWPDMVRSLVYSGVNPYPHPIYINNPLSFLRKVKHHYHLWSCLTCQEHTAPAFRKHSFHHICLHQWPFILQAYYVIHMGLGEKTASLYLPPLMTWYAVPYRFDLLRICTLWDQTKVEPLQEICTYTLNIYYVRLLKICNMKFIPPKHISPGN